MAELAALTALASSAAPYIALGSTALGAVGAIQESNAAQAASEANARQLEAKAKADLAQGTVNAEAKRKQADKLLSRQRAVAAASGAGMTGSAADIMADTAGQGAYTSELDLWLGRERSESDLYAAEMARAEARAKKRALPFNVGASVLTGVSQAASMGFGGGASKIRPFTTTVESYYG